MDPQQILADLINAGDDVLATHHPNPPNVWGFPTLDNGNFQGWRARCTVFLTNLLGAAHPYATAFSKEVAQGYQSQVRAGIEILRCVSNDLGNGSLVVTSSSKGVDVLNALSTICERFHVVARQLRSRQKNRPTIEIADEYDVQDLLHALLVLFFDDVRAEEWSPSYAGQATRMDFLLRQEEVVVEAKRSRKSMAPADLGSELLVDIARYKAHPSCGSLICFVYDPEGFLPNPRGLEHDLEDAGTFPVRVFIRP